ncbi:ALF repeat-containing protein, partial [Actinoplanes philippinensis]|uniref:ALF repeat-containing protein n=1 Tax=Actinoplanes philippinensis TaxID=35752 RepID=UPI003409D64B
AEASWAGDWSRASAADALVGDEADMRAWLSRGRESAAAQDDWDRLAQLATESGKETYRTAAKAVMDRNSHTEVAQFLRLPAYPAKEQEDRIEIAQLITAGGPATKAAAEAALNSTAAARHEFLRVGRYAAAEKDQRVEIGQLINTGGPEVKAAGEIALSGPRAYLGAFLESERYQAAMRDYDTNVHQVTVQRLVADGLRYAALARQQAAEAARVAAVANKAATEAAEWARKASEAAAQAKGYADQAAAAAADAKKSADAAAASAQLAKSAAATARQSAATATAAATRATASAQQAQASANRARGYAQKAKASAQEAQADADAAASAYVDAVNAEHALWRQEMRGLVDPYSTDELDAIWANTTPGGANTGLSEEEALRMVWEKMGKPGACFRGPLAIFPNTCDNMYAWSYRIVNEAKAAGIDPRLLMSVLMIEVGRSDELYPIDNSLQFGQWAADKMGFYRKVKSALGKGDSPPSLGWGNIQEAAFNETKARHPELKNAKWTDVMGNQDLSFKVTAYRLRDLREYGIANATEAMKNTYTPDELAAAMYNVGYEGFNEAKNSTGNLGKLGNSYAGSTRGNRVKADDLICKSNIWTC